jgi:hypothetical protein
VANLSITETQVLRGEDDIVERGIAGDTITTGMAVYLDDETRRWYPSSATGVGAATVVDGIALNPAGPKQAITVQPDGVVTLGAGAAPVVGAIYVLGSTPGSLAPITDLKIYWTRTVVGCGDAGNKLILGIINSLILPGSQVNEQLLKSHITPRQVSDNTAQIGIILDTEGYEEVTFEILIGTIADADATFTVLLEEGDNVALSDAAAVADVDMVSQTLAVAPETAASWNFGDDNEVRKLGYIGTKRYLRMTVTPALNAGAADFSVIAVLGAGPSSPLTQTPS